MKKQNNIFRILSFLCISIFFSFSVSLAENDQTLGKQPSPSEEEVRRAVVEALLYQESQNKKSLGHKKPNIIRPTLMQKPSQKKSQAVTQPLVDLNYKNQDKLRLSIQEIVTAASKKPKAKKVTVKVSPKPPHLSEIMIIDSKKQAMTRLIVTEEEPPKVLEKAVSSTSSTQKPVISVVLKSKVVDKPAIKLSATQKKTPTGRNQATITGWVYLGRFESGKWENKTLDIQKQLPKIGGLYAIKASRLNVRDALPKKGKLGKVIHAFYTEEKIKILRLKGSGRNKDYWAEVLKK